MTNAIPQTIIINTAKLIELAEFYRDGLQLPKPKATGNDHLGYNFGSVYLGFDLVPAPPKEYPGAVSIWFEVDNIEVVFSRFISIGGREKYPPLRKPWGAVLAALYDLDGNIIGLSQRGENPT
jgi:predicted enzyme related to lactoylglutathione lyase